MRSGKLALQLHDEIRTVIEVADLVNKSSPGIPSYDTEALVQE